MFCWVNLLKNCVFVFLTSADVDDDDVWPSISNVTIPFVPALTNRKTKIHSTKINKLINIPLNHLQFQFSLSNFMENLLKTVKVIPILTYK